MGIKTCDKNNPWNFYFIEYEIKWKRVALLMLQSTYIV